MNDKSLLTRLIKEQEALREQVKSDTKDAARWRFIESHADFVQGASSLTGYSTSRFVSGIVSLEIHSGESFAEAVDRAVSCGGAEDSRWRNV